MFTDRGLKFHRKITWNLQHVSACVAAAWKGAAANAKLLAPLWIEDFLDFLAATSQTKKMSDALCGIAKTVVRANCHEVAKEYGDVTSDVLKTFVKLMTLDFVAVDRDFYVELSILLSI